MLAYKNEVFAMHFCLISMLYMMRYFSYLFIKEDFNCVVLHSIYSPAFERHVLQEN